MIGQTLENYKIISLLGEGGVARVYLVEDIIDNKLYALKMLKQDYVSNQNIRKRFIDEAKKLSKINNINIAKVYKTIDRGDIVAFSMEHIDGDTLKSQSKLDTDSIKDYMYQILEGLKEVHRCGIVHRDLTPSNVMITKNGLVKILDFGISKDLNSTVHDGTIIGTTFTMGTPRYMSPEQYLDTAKTTITSDIYSLGVILWEMVTNEMVYGSINTIHSLGDKILKEDLPLTKTCWDRIIQKATEKTPSERYKNCDEFISAIKEFKCGAILPWKKIVIFGSTAIFVVLAFVLLFNLGDNNEEIEVDEKKEESTKQVNKPKIENDIPVDSEKEEIQEKPKTTNTGTQEKVNTEEVIKEKTSKPILIKTKLMRIPKQNRIEWNPELNEHAEKIEISFVDVNGKTWANDVVYDSYYDYSPGNSDAGGIYTTVSLNITMKDGSKIVGTTVLKNQIFKCN